MRRRYLLVLCWVAGFVFLCLSQAFGQQISKLADEEKADYYDKWLREDVAYIITDEEGEVFRQLTTNSERDRFIEQFWRRRDPTPQTTENEFREEHYRRIAYSNERFTSGKPGWKTDRGRIYILHGPPDEITYHQGGTLLTDVEEGSNWITAWPFEKWRYRFIPGVGSNVELEFVDKSGSGNFTLAHNPYEKYNMSQLHGQGRAATDLFGKLLEQGRLDTKQLGLHSPGVYTQAREFDRIFEYFKVLRPPEIKDQELVRVVETSIHYNEIAFDSLVQWFWVGGERVLAPLTIALQHGEFGQGGGDDRAGIDVYGQVRDLGGKIVYEFEDLIHAPEVLDPAGLLLYQRYLPLERGRYKLVLVLSDKEHRRLSTRERLVLIPRLTPGVLAASPVVLADLIRHCRPDETLPDPFVTANGLKIYPDVKHEVTPNKALGLYFEVYNWARDSATQKPSIDLDFELQRDGKKATAPFHTMPVPPLTVLADRVVVVRAIRVRDLQPGNYRLRITVRDKISDQTQVLETQFRLLSGSEKWQSPGTRE